MVLVVGAFRYLPLEAAELRQKHFRLVEVIALTRCHIPSLHLLPPAGQQLKAVDEIGRDAMASLTPFLQAIGGNLRQGGRGLGIGRPRDHAPDMDRQDRIGGRHMGLISRKAR